MLSQEELEAAVAPFLNRPLSFADLIAARTAVTQLYVQRGYITSGAYLAIEDNQAIDPAAAVITLRVVEGQVENVIVTGDERLRRYVRQRLEQAVRPVLNQPRLEEALRLLQSDPLVAQISATLSSGTRFDTSLLSVDVQAAPIVMLEPEISNGRSPAVGSFERSISGRAANLLGIGEQLQVGYRNTDGSNQWSAGLSIPLNGQNTTLSLGYSSLNAQIIEEPFAEFDIHSTSRLYQLGLRHPLLQRASNERLETLGLGIGAERIESETTILGQPEPLSVGVESQIIFLFVSN